MSFDPSDPAIWLGPFAEDPRSVEELLAVALGRSTDDNAYRFAIWALCYRAVPEVFEQALSLSTSPCPHERCTAASMLGHDLDRHDGISGAENRLAALRIMLHAEADPAVIAAILHALGHLNRPGVVDSVLPYITHPNPDLRFATVHALLGHADARAIAGLIALSRDPSTETRDWATFGLGSQTDADSPHLRQALVDRLLDGDTTVRGEALVGLAHRRDERGRLRLLALLAAHDVGLLELEAAEIWGDPALGPLLLALNHAEVSHVSALDDAIAACTPMQFAE